MSRLISVLFLIVLASCAETKSYEIASSPRQVTMCQSNNESQQTTLNRAEQQCKRHGRHAILVGEPDERCSFGPGTVMGWVQHYHCVR